MDGIGVVYALGCSLCYAGYQILTRKLSVTEPAMRQLFYTALIGTIAMSFVIPVYWTGEIPTLKQALIITSLGFFGGAGHFLLIRAFHETMASTLSPLLYVQLVWATLLGWIVFGHLADLPTTIGMLIIGGSSLSLALRWPRGGKLR
jgi:drug/metabolite transporter (DMT)-like permease